MNAAMPTLGHASSASVPEVQLASSVDPDVVSLPYDTGSTVDLEATYEQLVLNRLDERYLVVDHAVGHQSKCLAARVAEVAGTPHDVIEVHVGTLRRMTTNASTSRATALLDAGEHVLLLILGHLADLYRSMALRAEPA